jgi:NAD+ synthase
MTGKDYLEADMLTRFKKLKYDEIEKSIINFIKLSADDRDVVIGLSGGIDSALVMALCVKAVGAKRVKGLMMAEERSMVSKTIIDYAEALNVKYEIIPISPIVAAFKEYGTIEDQQIVMGNLKARIRMTLLYSRANAENRVVMGTGNRSELLMGYFTKYGDGGVDFLPIGDLYKTQVRALSYKLGVPAKIITQPPSAGLWEGQTDEAELGITYAKLDQILYAYSEQHLSLKDISLQDITSEEIDQVVKRVEAYVFKSTATQICFVK